MNIIEELYFGNIDPNMKQFIENDNFKKAMYTFIDNEDELTKLLEGKEKKLLLAILNAQSEINGATAVGSFVNGFKLGAKFALEITKDTSSCLR